MGEIIEEIIMGALLLAIAAGLWFVVREMSGDRD